MLSFLILYEYLEYNRKRSIIKKKFLEELFMMDFKNLTEFLREEVKNV
jgi:hypothetical protein